MVRRKLIGLLVHPKDSPDLPMNSAPLTGSIWPRASRLCRFLRLISVEIWWSFLPIMEPSLPGAKADASLPNLDFL